MKLGDSASVRKGQMLAFTGFPIGMLLGFHPATHRAMVVAITPVALPGTTARQLIPQTISRIRDSWRMLKGVPAWATGSRIAS
jgi:hypothetical protein